MVTATAGGRRKRRDLHISRPYDHGHYVCTLVLFVQPLHPLVLHCTINQYLTAGILTKLVNGASCQTEPTGHPTELMDHVLAH